MHRAAKIIWGSACSLCGFIAGPNIDVMHCFGAEAIAWSQQVDELTALRDFIRRGNLC